MNKKLFIASLFLYNICCFASEPADMSLEQNTTQNARSAAISFDYILELASVNDRWETLIDEAQNLAQTASNLSMNDCIIKTLKLIRAVQHEIATQPNSGIHGSLDVSLSKYDSLEDITTIEITAPCHIAISLMVVRNNETDLALWENIETIVAKLQNSLSPTEEVAEDNASAIEIIYNAVSELAALISEKNSDSISPYLYIAAVNEAADNIE